MNILSVLYVNTYCYEIHKAMQANIAISCTIVGVQ